MSLSFNIIRRLFGWFDALFSPSKARPPLIEASPTIATVLRFSCPGVLLSAMAMPNAAEMEFPACPAMNVSDSLSRGVGNPLIPPSVRREEKESLRPVRILCA